MTNNEHSWFKILYEEKLWVAGAALFLGAVLGVNYMAQKNNDKVVQGNLESITNNFHLLTLDIVKTNLNYKFDFQPRKAY